VIGALIAIAVASIAFGIWHGDRMYKLGVRAGRELEALDARHARERVLLDARREATLGAIKAEQDRQLVRRWVEDAFRRRGRR